MDLKENKKKIRNELLNKVLTFRSTLIKIGVSKAFDKFFTEHPYYLESRLRNLWYGKVVDGKFVTELEAFVERKKVEY